MPFKTATLFQSSQRVDAETLSRLPIWEEPEPGEEAIGLVEFDDGLNCIEQLENGYALRFRFSQPVVPSSATDYFLTKELGPYVHTKEARAARRSERTRIYDRLAAIAPQSHRHVRVIVTPGWVLVMSATKCDVDGVIAEMNHVGITKLKRLSGSRSLTDCFLCLVCENGYRVAGLKLGEYFDVDVDGMKLCANMVDEPDRLISLLVDVTQCSAVEIQSHDIIARVSSDWKLRSIDTDYDGKENPSVIEMAEHLCTAIPHYLTEVIRLGRFQKTRNEELL